MQFISLLLCFIIFFDCFFSSKTLIKFKLSQKNQVNINSCQVLNLLHKKLYILFLFTKTSMIFNNGGNNWTKRRKAVVTKLQMICIKWN